MRISKTTFIMAAALAASASIWLLAPAPAMAHCDTLDGPVVTAAKTALAKGDITPILKWIKQDDEKDVREAFNKALVVRAKGKEAQELADMYFFETLVRIHRAGEGAPYTGLKSAEVEPPVAAADKALESGSADALVKMVADKVAEGIRERFHDTYEKKKQADKSVEAGREFVESYVGFTHYAERLYMDAAHSVEGHKGEAGHKE